MEIHTSNTLVLLMCYVFSVNAFLEESGFDPNAINGFPAGAFNPNAGISTIPTPAISGGGGSESGGSGFNPNANQASTIAPPTLNGFTGWAGSGSGSGQFNPNAGYTTSNPNGGGDFGGGSFGGGSFGGGGWGFGGSTARPAARKASTTKSPTTSNPFGGGSFGGGSFGGGGWGFGGNTANPASKSRSTTKSPFGNFGNNYWGFGTGAGGFNPNAPFTTVAPPPTIHPTTITIHPTTPTPWPFYTKGQGQGNPTTVALPHNLPIRSKAKQGANVANGFGSFATKLFPIPTTTIGTLAPTSDGPKSFTNVIIG